MEALEPAQMPFGDPEALSDHVRGIVLEVVADHFAIQLSEIREMLSATQATRSVAPDQPGPSAQDTPAQPAGEEPRKPGEEQPECLPFVVLHRAAHKRAH